MSLFKLDVTVVFVVTLAMVTVFYKGKTTGVIEASGIYNTTLQTLVDKLEDTCEQGEPFVINNQRTGKLSDSYVCRKEYKHDIFTKTVIQSYHGI